MHHYRHHIGDFDRATRHLTRIERSIYRDLMDVYYDTEAPLTSDTAALCRRVLARSEAEKAAVLAVLDEFFHQTPAGWFHDRCEEEIAEYHKGLEQASKAGKASAAARAERRRQAMDQTTIGDKRPLHARSTPVEQPLNGRATDGQQEGNGTATNHKPITRNQKPETNNTSGQGPDGAPPVPRKRVQGSESDRSTAAWMAELVRLANPAARAPNLDAWANDVRLMREIDGRTDAQIRELFDWAKRDAFWCANIQSPAKLREKWDTLTGQRLRRPGAPGAHQFGGADRSGDRQAQQAAMARRGVTVPDGEVQL